MTRIIKTGDFRIDLEARTVWVCDRELQLSSEEFDLLVFLAGHPTSVITAHTTLSTRCGENLVRRAGVLQVLPALQKKIEASVSGGHYIRTEPMLVCRFNSTVKSN